MQVYWFLEYVMAKRPRHLKSSIGIYCFTKYDQGKNEVSACQNQLNKNFTSFIKHGRYLFALQFYRKRSNKTTANKLSKHLYFIQIPNYQNVTRKNQKYFNVLVW